MNAKNLHKHSLPVLGLLTVAFVLSISLANRLATASTQNILARALVTRYIQVTPTANGLARIHINPQIAGASVVTVVDPATASDFRAIGDTSGKLVRLSFVVESLNPTKLMPRK